MAHFAEIGTDNVVIRVLVVPDEEAHRGQEFLADDLSLGGTWLQTDKKTMGNVHWDFDEDLEPAPSGEPAFRGNYAGTGSVYNPDEDVFHSPEPSEGDWVLSTETWLWEPVT